MTVSHPLQTMTRSWTATAALPAAGWEQVTHGSEQDTDLLSVLFWPEELSTPAQVRVQVGPSRPITSWLDAGYRVSGYDGGALGPGVQCVAEQKATVAGNRIVCIAAHYLFVAGEETVVVTVDPTLAEMFALLFVGLHQLIGTLEVARPDGCDFRSHPVPGYSTELADTWGEFDTGR